jgi:hypothetical protein
MNVSFGSAALAALCNSEQRLAQRWGPDVGHIVGRRLLDLAAVESEAIDRLPGANVSTDGAGDTTITFSNQILVRGVMNVVNQGRRGAPAESESIVITSLEVNGGDQ